MSNGLRTSKKKPKPSTNGSNLVIWVLVSIGLVYFLNVVMQPQERAAHELAYSRFFEIVNTNNLTQKIKSCVKTDNIVKGVFSDDTKFSVNVPENDHDLIKALRENVKDFDVKPPKTLWINMFYSFGPVIFLIILWVLASR